MFRDDEDIDADLGDEDEDLDVVVGEHLASGRTPVFTEPVYTTRDRFNGFLLDLKRLDRSEESHKTAATRRRPRLERVAWRGFRVIPMGKEIWEAIPEELKYIPVLISPEERRTTGEPWEQDIDPPAKTVRSVKSGKSGTASVSVNVVLPDHPPDKIWVWRPVIFYTPDANPTRNDSRHFDGFGLIPKDEVEQMVAEKAASGGLDQYQGVPYSQVPPNARWRLRQLYAEARLDVFFGPRDEAWPGGRRWREGYVNYEKAYHRFRQYVEAKRADGWSDSKIYDHDNIYEEFFQLVYSEWGQFWRLINALAQQTSPENGLQDPWQSTQALEDIADLFSVRPPVSLTKLTDEDGKLIMVDIDRANPPSISTTKYDAEAIGKWIEGNNAAMGLYQNADEAQVTQGSAQNIRDHWFGGASYNHLIKCLRLRLPYDVRVFGGEPIVREMLRDTGSEPNPDEYIGPDHHRIVASEIGLPPFTQLWSQFGEYHVDLSTSREALDEITERLIKKGQFRHGEINEKYGGRLINWQRDMVWVWEDDDGHWVATPPDRNDVDRGLVTVFPREYWPGYIDCLGTAKSEHFNYQTWRSRLRQNLTRAGITDDLYDVTPFNAFNHEEIARAVWLYQSADNLRYTLERVVDDAQINREVNYLEAIVRATEDLPTIENGRSDMEEVVWKFRADAVEWYLRRLAEFHFYGWGRVGNISSEFLKGMPWRIGDQKQSWYLMGQMGYRYLKCRIGDNLAGRGEERDETAATLVDEYEFVNKSLRARGLTYGMHNREDVQKVKGDGWTVFYRRQEIADWLTCYVGMPEPTKKEWQDANKVRGETMQVAQMILMGEAWPTIEARLGGLSKTPLEIRRAYYCYAPVNGIPLD